MGYAVCMCANVNGYKIVNVYKPPPTQLKASDLPVFPHPILYAGDFNCPHADCGYGADSANGECLLVGQVLTAVLSFVIQRILQASILTAGTMVLTLILCLLVLTQRAAYLTDAF